MDTTECLIKSEIASGDEFAGQCQLLSRLLHWADNDPRILAVHLKGSLARREGDRHSDVDAVLDVKPADWAGIWDERRTWTALFGDVVHTLEHQWGPVTDTICYAVLCRDGVQLDSFIHCGRQPAADDLVTLWTRDGAANWPTPATIDCAPSVQCDQLSDYLDLYWMGSLLCAKYIARARCGFGAYFTPDHYEDHWCCEYWNGERWVSVDAQLDALQREKLGIDFGPLDMPPGKFVPASDGWLMCRAGREDPDKFGIFDMHGLWLIRGDLIRELAAA